MLPSTPGTAQQFHALPACVEDVNMDILLQSIDNFQPVDIEHSGQQQVEEVYMTQELQELLANFIPDFDTQYPAASPGLVFGVVKMPLSVQESKNKSSPVIPLSVQQEQMDSIHPRTIVQSDYIQNDLYELADDLPTTATTASYLSTERSIQTSTPEMRDQTVPFRRHDSACSGLSTCSIKTERCSVSSEHESMTPPSSILSTSLPATSRLQGPRTRGQRSSDDLNGDTTQTDKKLRRREQNRRAATKCRTKRRLEYEQLRKNYDAVMKDNDQLKTQLIQLATQYERLQNELARHHQQCGLTLPTNNR